MSKDLKVAWLFHTGVFNEGASLQVTPIVVNGGMYVTDGHSDVFALNAATGKQLWAYKPTAIPNELPPFTLEGLGPRGPTSFSGISTCCGLNNQGWPLETRRSS
jgi:glucose dehydrogenase